MTYVINPWFFYWMNVVDNLIAIVSIVLILILIGFGMVCLVSFFNLIDGEELPINFKKIIKPLIISITICILIVTFVPSKTTLYEMIIAQNVTYENIEKTKKEGIKLVDYIIEKTEEYNKKKDGD